MKYEEGMRWYAAFVTGMAISYLIGCAYFLNYIEKHQQDLEPPNINNQQHHKNSEEINDLNLARCKELEYRYEDHSQPQ